MPAPYGPTPTGFNRKTLPEIIESLETGIKDVFGPETNLKPQSPDGQLLGVYADASAEIWELAENVYHSFDPTQVSGDRLDALLAILQLPPRAGAIYTGIAVTFTGDPGITIPAGTSISSSTTATVMYTREISITDSTGSATTIASPSSEGAINVAANEMDTLTTPITGISGVINTSSGIIGVIERSEETDMQIRLRLLGTAGGVGVSSRQIRLENILRGLANVVESVLYVNDKDSVDNRGIPGTSYAAVIEGGDEVAIANAMWMHHSPGVGTFGSTTVNITDSQGICRKMNFSRPREVIALLDITVRYVDGRCGCQPHDLNTLKTKLIELLTENRQDCGGFGIGQPLIRSRLYAAFSDIPGLEIVDLLMAKQHYVFSIGCPDPEDLKWNEKGFCGGEWAKPIDWSLESLPIAWDEKPIFVENGITLKVIDKFDNTIAEDCLPEEEK